jgi:hypothetical protein
LFAQSYYNRNSAKCQFLIRNNCIFSFIRPDWDKDIINDYRLSSFSGCRRRRRAENHTGNPPEPTVSAGSGVLFSE